jgi:hypothetical protein
MMKGTVVTFCHTLYEEYHEKILIASPRAYFERGTSRIRSHSDIRSLSNNFHYIITPTLHETETLERF